MLIQELRKHFPARMPEWWNAGTMFFWGAYIILHPGIFNDDLFAGFISIARFWGAASVEEAERFWGLITVLVGSLRLCALFVNGSYSRTPMVRLICSAVSVFVWTQVVVGLLSLPVPTTGLVMYSAVAVLDLISAYRAALDTAIAEAVRRSGPGGEKRVITVGYSEVGV